MTFTPPHTHVPIIQPDSTAQYVLVAVSMLFVIGFWCWIMWTLYKDPPAPAVYFQCIAGECATNIYNGEKRCTNDDTSQTVYDPSYEVCNSKYTCENPRTSYALMSDGSTNELGACEANTICRCLAKPQCASDIVTVFNVVNGCIEQDGDTSRAIFSQVPMATQGDVASTVLTFDDSNTQFCAMKAYHLNRLAPGACMLSAPGNITLAQMHKCMNDNPCMVGALAFYPLDAASFTLNSGNMDAIYSIPVACVPSVRSATNDTGRLKGYCTGTQIPVWDRARAAISCYDTGS